MIKVNLAYVDRSGQLLLMALSVPEGCLLIEAITLSGILETHTELASIKEWLAKTPIDLSPNHRHWYVGVFSQKKALNYRLTEGDRIEFYRPLTLDPIKQRKQQAQKSEPSA